MNLYSRLENKVQNRAAVPAYHTAHCPNCGHRTEFSYGGEQHWPVEVAEKVGVPETVRLWHCLECRSTFCETTLKL